MIREALSFCFVSLSFASLAAQGASTGRVAQVETSAATELARAERLYDSGEYEKARDTLDKLVKRESLITQAERSKLYQLRARVEYAFSGESGLRLWLAKLVDNDSSYELDPIQDPPAAHNILKEIKEKRGVANAKPPPTFETRSPARELREHEEPWRAEAKYWVRLLPFGIGHFETGDYVSGGAFLGSEVAVLVAAASTADDEFNARERDSKWWRAPSTTDSLDRTGAQYYSSVLGTFGFLGLWSHEVVHLLPEITATHKERGEWIRYGLSFAPFGAAQLKNGQVGKAIGLGVVQTALLTGGVVARTQQVRDTMVSLFFVSMIYGGLDGWLNHEWDATSVGQHSRYQLRFAATPIIAEQRRAGVVTNVELRF